MSPNKKIKDQTDWQRVEKMKDEEIDFSEIPEQGEEFFKNAKFRLGNIEQIVDPDVLAFFKNLGKDYKEKINKILRAHIEVMRPSNV